MYRVKVKGERLTEPLTATEQAQILELTREGKLKRHEIARLFRVHPQTIKILCDRNGVGRWAELTPALEEEAVRLLREGKAVGRVAHATRLQRKVIRDVMVKHRIHHKVGGGPKLSLQKTARIVEAVQAHEDHMYRLAKQIGVDRGTIRKIAYEVLGVDRFIGYPNIRPLTSLTNSDEKAQASCQQFLETVFREKFSTEAQAMELTGIFVRLVQDFTTIWYDGQIPTDRASFISEVLEAYMPQNRPEFLRTLTDAEWAKERAVVVGYLRAAVDTLRTTQSGVVH